MNNEDFEKYLQRFMHNRNVAKKYLIGFLTDDQQVRVLTEVIHVLESAKKKLLK